MKKIYTQQTIDQFFEEFKNLPNSYKIEKVHQLLNNPNAKATHKVNSYFNQLKSIIMISTLFVSFSALILVFSPGKNLDANSSKKNLDVTNIETINETFLPSNGGIISENTPEKTEPNPGKANSITIEPKQNDSIPTNMAHIEKLGQESHSIIENEVDRSEFENQNCDWPADTIIDKNILLIELTDSELNEIGIVKYGDEKNGYEIYYNNLTPNGTPASAQSGIRSIIPDVKKIQTNYDFYRVTLTTINFIPYFNEEVFYSSLDTLVPIVLRVGNPKQIFPKAPDEIYWFSPHETLFEKLPERYHYLKDVYWNLQCLKSKYPDKSFTNYLSPTGNNIFKTVNAFDLNREELRQIGINVVGQCIVLQAKYNTQNSSFCANSNVPKDRNYYDSIDIVRIPESSFPILETDTLGRIINYNEFDYTNNNIVEKNLDVLVPIKISKSELLNVGYKTEIWWYYPSDEFISTLPNRIKNNLKIERDAILSDNYSESSCTYFEACKSTLQLENFKLYPNPANYSVTIEFDLTEKAEGAISIVNIAGAKIKTLVSNSTFQSGHNTHQMDLSGITPGIYLISINTNKGFKTQRLIVSQ